MSRQRIRGIFATAAFALLVWIALSAGPTFGSFTQTGANSGNSFTAASDFFRFASGSYTGNGASGRAITGVGFKPGLVLIKANATSAGVGRTSTMSGDATKPLSGGTALTAGQIQSLDSDGFTIGTNASVNTSGTTYQWAAFESGRELKVGSYTGNGAATRSITGFGFQPELVAVLPASAQIAVLRATGMTTSFAFGSNAGAASQINSLDADGFTVGNSASTNTSGTAYHYVAFNDATGTSKSGSYAGNALDNTNITGVGFQPKFVLVRGADTLTSRRTIWRTNSLSGDSSMSFTGVAFAANQIQSFLSDGFQVGTDGNVNALAITNYYLAITG